MTTFFDDYFWAILTVLLMTIALMCSFFYSTTNRHAHRAALAWIGNELSLVDYHYQANLRTCMRNLDKELNFGRSELYVQNIRNDVKLVNDAESDLLTSRQQLILLDSLLGTKTKTHHTRKITKTRTVKDIVEIAVNHVRDNNVSIAPRALFS
ncbi:hypothetical protein pEaSNUABM37_00271 [Erwinia phage pEa_SNUABM_37]|nr:hypothetical protein pEaSNUABM37_00271 [Erwinia phage pEa_SNUABM_37]QXO10739.1 hypothetical protein pEaSNUABM48_00271 [Erwinia phage pEa_SNUABM_48]